MRNWLLKLLLIIGFVRYSTASAYAEPFAVSADNETVAVDDNFIYSGIVNSYYANTIITVNTTSSELGVIASGSFIPAISIESSSSLSSLTIDSGTLSSENLDSDSGTIILNSASGTSPIINVGKNSGTSGIIENRGTGGNAIYSESVNTSLTINNKATGTISAAGYALKLIDVSNSSSLSLNNEGTISGDDYAIYLDGYSAEIANSGTISGNIAVVSDSALSITNNAGEISGDIDLGSNTNSVINLNGGTISGDVVMRDDDQLFIFNGGNLDGSSIDGYSSGGTHAGTVRIDSNTNLSGFIGKNNPVSVLEISDGITFSFNNHYSRVAKIIIGASATLDETYGYIDTDEIDGSDTNQGIFTLRFLNVGAAEIATPIGTTNGLEQFNIIRNLTEDPTAITVITLSSAIKAETTKIENTGNIVRVASGNTITGDVKIDDGAKLQLDNGSSVSGTIQAITQYSGTLEIYNSRSDGAVSSVTLNSDVGGDSKDLAFMIVDYATIVDATAAAINAQTIYLYSLSNLQLGTATVTGTIKGYVDSGSSNGFGDVTFTAENTLGGNLGTSNGNALNGVTLSEGIAVAAGSYEINATTIYLNSGATLSTSGFISGGDNDDSGESLKDTGIYINDDYASLILNDGSAIYASIDGPGRLEINTNLNSGNSHLNIGDGTVLSRITLDDNVTLDVTGNDGSLKADDIFLGDSSTIKLGDGEIVGRINGNANDDWGTLDIRGNVTLDGEVGAINSINLFNIGASDDGGYSVTAHDSIIANSVTINGASTSLSLDDERSITSNVVIGDDAELSLGNGSTVNGTITGASQNYGILKIRSGATVAAGGNIGAGDLDLSNIKIHGTFDLSGLSAYSAHAQTFSLTNGASLIIGAGVIEGDIKGFSDDGGATDGFGQGSVSFSANIDPTNFLVSNIGTTDGHALSGLFIGENLVVDTGTTNISAEIITLYAGASLTSSASSITGGDQIYGGFSRLNTQVKLNDGASLTLNNVDKFLGTIDGNDDGQGSLTLTGNYVYNDGDDAIDIGATKKLASVTLSEEAELDLSISNGIIKADAINLNNYAILTLGSGDIVGTIDSDANETGIVNILGNATLGGAIGGTHKLGVLSIGDYSHFNSVTANASISADSITLTSTHLDGEITSLTLSHDNSITGNVVMDFNTKLYLGDNSYVDGTITGASQYQGELNILEGASVNAYDNIGAGGFDLASVGINDGSTLNLNDYSLSAQSISLIDDAAIVIGDAIVTGDILGYLSSGAAYGSGSGTVTFNGVTSSLGGNIGNDIGNAVNYVYVNGGGKSLDTSGYSIYSANIIVATSSNLTVSGIIAGSADETDDHALSATNLILNSGTTLTLDDGASLFATVNGVGSVTHTGTLTVSDNVTINSNITIGNSRALAAVNLETSATLDLSAHDNVLKADLISLASDSNLILGSGAVAGVIDGAADDSRGKVTAVSSATYGSGVTFGSTHGLSEIDFGTNSGATISVANSINADLVKIIGPDTTLNLGDSAAINGNVVIAGDAALSLGNGSTVNGTITNLSDETPNAILEIRSDATVQTNGDIGGGGYNFYGVVLLNGSQLDLSANNNSITSLLVRIGDGANLTIGSATVSAIIQAYNFEDGSNYGLGSVTFADNNTLGEYVGADNGATLESVTINSGKNVDGDSHRIAALDIILEDGASLTNTGSISAGTATEGGPLENARIKLGDDAILGLSEISGEAIFATIDGVDSANQGKLQILSGSVTAYANIGNNHSLEEVSLADGTTLNLVSTVDEVTHNAVLKAGNILLDDNSTLSIGTNSVTGNISGLSNGLGTVVFSGATNSLAGNVGGHNDNALANVTINNSNSVNVGSYEINASTITLSSYSTLVSSGAISAGADVTGTTPIATAIYLQANALLKLYTGSSVFGTIDAASSADEGLGAIEFSLNLEDLSATTFTTNGDIGSTNKLNSVIVDDGVTLDLGTHSNSLNASTLYLGSGSTLALGDAGTVSAAIASLTADSGVVYLNDSVTLDSGSTLGGVSGLLSLYIDNTAAGDVVVDSHDSIKARDININGFRSSLNLSENKTISGNVNLGDGARLNLSEGSAVSGTIDSVNDSGGALRISGTVTSQSNIGNAHALGSVTLDDISELDLSAHDNILKSDSVTLGDGSILRVGSGEIVGSFVGGTDSAIIFTKDNTIAEGTFLGNAADSTSIFSFEIDDATVNQNENVVATYTYVYGDLIVATNKGITGDDVFLNGGTLTLKNNSYIDANVSGFLGAGSLIIDDNASVTTTHYLGNPEDSNLALDSIVLNAGSTLDIATNNNNISAENIILNDGATLDIGSAFVAGTIKGNSQIKGDVNFHADNDLAGNLGATAYALDNITIKSSLIGNSVDTQGHAIYAQNIILESKAELITSSSISAGSDDDVTAITLNNDSTLSLNNGASIVGAINAVSTDADGIGSIDVDSGTVTINGNIGDTHKIKTITIADGATLNNSANSGIINAADITVGTGSTLTMSNISGSGSGDFGLKGNVNGAGKVNLSVAGGTYNLNATLGESSTLAEVNITSSFNTLNIANSIQADTLNFNSSGGYSYLTLAANKTISGDVVLGSGTLLNLKNNSSIGGNIEASDDNFGDLIIGTVLSGSGGADSLVVANGAIGSNEKKLALIQLNDNAALDLATHSIDAFTYDSSIGENSILEIGDGSFTSVNNLTMDDSSSLTIGGGSLSASGIVMTNNSSITIGSGTIYGDVYGDGSVTINGDSTANGKLGTNDLNNVELINLTISDGASLITDYEIAASSIDINGNLTTSEAISGGTDGTTIFTSEITLGSDAILQLNNSPFVIANINGTESGDGEIDIFGEITGEINIGNSTKINQITIDNDSFLDVATHDTSVNANNITLASSGALIVGTTTINSAIDGSHDDYGLLTIAAEKTTTTNGNIGSSHSLNDVEIGSGATLDLATNGNSLNATTIQLASDATLNVGSGEIKGTFIGQVSDGSGSIHFYTDKTIASNLALLGTSESSLENITIENSANLTVSNSIYANHINIGTSGAAETSLTLNLSGTNEISGEISLTNSATLAINNNGLLTIGAISSTSNNVGTLNVEGGGTLTLNGDIGDSSHALSTISVGENSLINAYSNNASIFANDIYLSSGAEMVMSGGTLSATIHGVGTGGAIYFTAGTSHSLTGDLGSATDDVGLANVTLQGFLDIGQHDIRTSEFVFDSADAALTFNDGDIDITTFTNNNSGNGTINFEATNNLNFAIDADNTIAQLNIADGATITANQLINASTTTIGEGTSGKLILAANKTLVSDVTINSGANLTLNNASTLNGNILGASSSGSGTLEINGSASIAGNIGTAENKISALTLNSGAVLNIASGTTNAAIASSSGSGKIKLANGATLAMQNGSSISNEISGASAGYGDITASGTVSFGAIGTTNSINNFTSASGSSATFGGNIFANGDININGAAIFSNASTEIHADSFNVNSGSSLSLSINLSSPQASVLEIAGAAMISANTNLNLTISGSAASGTIITLINAGAGSSISAIDATKINLNNSGSNILHGQTYETSVLDDQLLLTLSGDATVDSLTFANPNLQNAYDAIANSNSASGNLALMQDYLSNALYSSEQKEAAVNSTTPQVDNSANRIAFNNIATNAQLTSTRLANLQSGIASGDKNIKQNSWGQIFGTTINQANTSAGDGYNAKSSGMAFGYDKEISDEIILGFSGVYNQSKVDGKNSSKSNNIDSYQLSLYSGYSHELFFLNSTIGYSINQYKSRRGISVAHAQASANYSGDSYSARAELGTNFKLENKIILTPTFTITAARNNVDAYDEGGAGTLNLHVNGTSTDFFETRFGTEISKMIVLKNRGKIRPNFAVSYGYDFAGNKQKSSANFIGQNLNLANSGAKIAQGSLKIGTGVTLYDLSDSSLSLNYNFEHRSAYISHTGWLNAKVGF